MFKEGKASGNAAYSLCIEHLLDEFRPDDGIHGLWQSGGSASELPDGSCAGRAHYIPCNNRGVLTSNGGTHKESDRTIRTRPHSNSIASALAEVRKPWFNIYVDDGFRIEFARCPKGEGSKRQLRARLSLTAAHLLMPRSIPDQSARAKLRFRKEEHKLNPEEKQGERRSCKHALEVEISFPSMGEFSAYRISWV